jgi:hypothetical protein
VDGEFAIALEQNGAVVPPSVCASVDGLEEHQAAGSADHRFHLQPMWRRPVRGLGLVEPWLLSRHVHDL